MPDFWKLFRKTAEKTPMGLTLHSQIAALPLTGTLLGSSRIGEHGRLYGTKGDQYPINIVEDRIGEGRQGYFISADEQHFHGLTVIRSWDHPGSTDSRARMLALPGLPPLIFQWNEMRIRHVFYPRSEQMIVSLELKQRAVHRTLIDGAFYAYASETDFPVPANLDRTWTELTREA